MSKQSSKTKANLPAGGLFPLGRDTPNSDAAARIKGHSLKRELPPVSAGTLKKPRFELHAKGTSVGSSGSLSKRYVHSENKWREFCAEITFETKSLLPKLESAFEKQKPQKAARLICAAVREIIDHRREGSCWIREPIIVSALHCFLKSNSTFLMQDEVVDALCSLLAASIPAPSPGLSAPPLWLFSILKDSAEWNWSLVECFFDDSLHERCWVDRISAGPFVANILTAFGTRIPSEAVYSSSELQFPERFARITEVADRFSGQAEKPAKLDILIAQIREMCERKSEGSAPKNLLRTMSLCSGCSQVRMMAAKKMDSWLLNGKLQRLAMELLLWIASNLGTNTAEEDLETLSSLLKLRALKSKQINNLFNVALREILNNDKEIMSAVMKLLLANEFTSSNRFPLNMNLIHSLFAFDNIAASKVLASEICSMLAAKEECIRVSRTFLREFSRSLQRIHFDFATFCQHLFEAVDESFTPFTIPHFLFKSLMELCSMFPFLAITPVVREGAQLRRNPNSTLSPAHVEALQRFYSELRKFFEICIEFLASHHSLCNDSRLFVHSFYRLLYLATVEYYSSIDNWPVEADVTQYMRAISDAPISESLLISILNAGFDQSIPFDAADAIDLVENLTKRASLSSPLNGFGSTMIPINECSTIMTLFKTTTYRPPSAFHIDDDDLPPLSVRTLYWKAWIVAVMWVSLNKGSLIKEAYEKFPTLKVVMQILLTREYRYPHLLGAGDLTVCEKILEEEEKEALAERDTIKRLEARLAGGDVHENDSKLLGKLCMHDPTGMCRQPPDSFLRDLEKLNDDLDLSRSLSECRDPDLLADIIRSQGSAQALRPIMNLVETNASAIAHLPLECVCELFLHYIVSSVSPSINNSKRPSTEKLNSMRSRLRSSLKGPTATEVTASETLEFLATRLGATSAVERSCAAHSLSLLLNPDANVPVLPVLPDASPTRFLGSISCFETLKGRICSWVSQLCPVETDAARLTEYIDFLIENAEPSSMHLVACRVSSLVERLSDAAADLNVRSSALSFFEKYMREAQQNEGAWTSELDSQLPANAKKVTVQFERPGKIPASVEMTSSSVGGILQLLCSHWGEEGGTARDTLMDIWFPADGHRPKVLNAEGIELLPPWLKLKMLTTEDDRIVQVALGDVKGLDALKFVQSFGLTSYSCSKLFTILDKDSTPLVGEVLSEANKAAPFVRAYKLKGATGGDKFLARLSKALSVVEGVKVEVDDDESQIALDPLPASNGSPPVSDSLAMALSTDEAVQCIEQALSQSKFSDSRWHSAINQMSKDVKIATAVVALLKRKPQLFSNTLVVSGLLITMAAMKDEQLRNDLCSLYTIVSRKPSIAESVKRILRSVGPEVVVEKREKKSRSANSLNAEEILMQLAVPPKPNDAQTSFIQRYLCVCPELLPPFSDEGTASAEHPESTAPYRIITLLFSSSSPALRYIISLMPTRCSPSVISKILSFLLGSHNTSLSSSSVMDAVMNGFKLADPCPLSRRQCPILAEYMLDELQRDAATMEPTLNFLDEMARTRDDIAHCMISAFSDILNTSASSHRKRFVKLLMQNFSARYPDVLAENDFMRTRNLRSVSSNDRIMHSMISDLFAAADCSASQVSRCIDALAQVARAQPHVFARHLSLISASLISVVRLPARLLRDRYRQILPFILKLLLSLAPGTFEDANQIQPVLEAFFYFFNNVGKSRVWALTAQIFLNVCISFLELNAKRARPFFVSHSNAVKQFTCGMDSLPAKTLLDIVNTANPSNES